MPPYTGCVLLAFLMIAEAVATVVAPFGILSSLSAMAGQEARVLRLLLN